MNLILSTFAADKGPRRMLADRRPGALSFEMGRFAGASE